MAEEFRLFVRTALYLAAAGAVYWLVSHEPAGTALLVGLLVGILAFVAAGLALAPRAAGELRAVGGRGILGFLNRAIGFHERADAAPPLEGGPDLVPLSSAWPVLTAAAMVIIGLGLIFGSWLTVPGVVLLLIGGVGWLTQLDAR